MTIKKLPSGWYAIFHNGTWIDAACLTKKQAEEKMAVMIHDRKNGVGGTICRP